MALRFFQSFCNFAYIMVLRGADSARRVQPQAIWQAVCHIMQSEVCFDI
jgi:hypothetical protein